MTKVAALLTCFNRKSTTLKALTSLYASAAAAQIELSVFLVDDASTDGTSEAIKSGFPSVHVIQGSGNLFWNGGMRLAWQSAAGSHPDFFLWLNDDLELLPESLGRLIQCYEDNRDRFDGQLIVVGKVASPSTGQITYGGYACATGFSKLRFRRLRADETLCDTMNGNCVLIPRRAAEDVGINSEKFRHSFGDIDYGLRARRAGYGILEHAGPVGFQEDNLTYKDSISRLSSANWKFVLFHPKGVPWIEWLHFCREHAGALWPVNFAFRYLKMLLNDRRT